MVLLIFVQTTEFEVTWSITCIIFVTHELQRLKLMRFEQFCCAFYFNFRCLSCMNKLLF